MTEELYSHAAKAAYSRIVRSAVTRWECAAFHASYASPAARTTVSRSTETSIVEREPGECDLMCTA